MADVADPIDEALQQLVDIPDPAASQPQQAQQAPAGAQTPQASSEISLAPLTQAQAIASKAKFEANIAARSTPKRSLVRELWLEDLGERPGVPLNIEHGVPELRNVFAKMPTPQEGIVALENRLGKGKARLNKFNQPVVTMTEQGVEKDYLVNPLGLDMGDLKEITAQKGPIVGATIGAIAAAVATQGLTLAPSVWTGIAGVLATASGGAAGTFAGGVAQDERVRRQEGLPQQYGQSLGQRGVEAGIGFGIDVATGGAGRVAAFLRTPLSGPRRVFDTTAAQQRLFADTGVEIPLTIGERTGSGIALRAEAAFAQQPGSSHHFDRFLEERARQVRQLREIAEGRPMPESELAGQRGVAALRAETEPIEQAVEGAARDVIETGERTLAGRARRATGLTEPVDKNQLGEQFRRAAYDERARRIGGPGAPPSEADQLYARVFGDPRVATKNIDGNPIAQEAQALRQNLPTVTERGEQVQLERLIPSGVMSIARELERGAGQRFRLDELMTMRQTIRNQIAEGEAVPGYKTRYLNQMRDMLTDRIQTGLRQIDPALETAWQTANDFYAAQARRFEGSGIAEMFRTPAGGGFVPGTEIIKRATTGSNAQHYFQAYRDFFGAGSPEMAQLSRAVVDDVFDRGTLSVHTDAAGFARRLTSLAHDSPELAREVFGGNLESLVNTARSMRAARGEVLPIEEMNAALQSGTLTGEKLAALQTAEAAKTARYQNELLRGVRSGAFEQGNIRPTEFVDRLVFRKETQPAHLTEVMGMLGKYPDVVEDVRRLTMKRVFDEATVARGAKGIETIDSNAIRDMLADENQMKRLRSVLTPQDIRRIEDVATVFDPSSNQSRVFRAAGGLAASGSILQLVKQGEFRYVSQWVKNHLIAAAYTSDTLERFVSNTRFTSQDKANIANLLIGSGPFIRSLMETYGKETAVQAQTELKQSIDRSQAEREGGAVNMDDIDAAIRELR